MRKSILRFATLLCVGGFMYVTLSSKSVGMFGKFNTGCGGTGCHAAAASSATSVTITGLPSSLLPNTAYPLVINVANAFQPRAGFNFSASLGTVSTTTPTSVKLDALNVEATHAAPKLAAAGSTSFNVTWQSPSAFPNGAVTFMAAGNAVNGMTNSSNDDWNKVSITVPAQFPASINAETQIKVSISPTVVTDRTTIVADQIQTLAVYNLTGARVFNTTVKGATHYSLDASAFAAGEYIVKGTASGKPFTTKFVKL